MKVLIVSEMMATGKIRSICAKTLMMLKEYYWRMKMFEQMWITQGNTFLPTFLKPVAWWKTWKTHSKTVLAALIHYIVKIYVPSMKS